MDRKLISIGAKCELARRFFFDYCCLKSPDFYKPNRTFLKKLCDTLQDFPKSNKKVLLVDLPPRHGKSRTLQLFVEWSLGHDHNIKIMTGSYNDSLSTVFAKGVRNAIQEIHADDLRPVYSDIFPGTRIKPGDGAMNMWSLEDGYNNYLATSPKGTATGFGADYIIIDDLIKNAEEAHNESVLEGHWLWFCFVGNTQIATSTGNKLIKDVSVGDKVLTFNHSQCIIEEQMVVKTNSHLDSIYRLEFNNGTKVECTGNHQFYTNKGYLSVEQILSAMRCSVKEGETILFPTMQEQSKGRTRSKDNLQELWQGNSVGQEEQTDNVLFCGMPKSVQSKGCTRSVCKLGKTARCTESKTQEMRKMWKHGKFAGASHRPQHKKQFDRQPCGSLQFVPYTLSQVTRIPSSELQRVYDIEVEGNHNFFANGLLVHNCNTMLSRLEEGGKIIVVMTRWATTDFAGRILAHFGDAVEHINIPAVQPDGSMLCDEILSRESCEEKKRAMGIDIWSANYQQEPIDIRGRLYTSFKTYDGELPKFKQIRSYVDTADTGADFLCGYVYGVTYQHEAYILDTIYTQKPMEYTEPATARMLFENHVNVARIESNNGGRGFARNVERILKQDFKTNKTVVQWFTQTKNKVSRILSNSTWCMEHIYFPAGWQNRWSDLAEHLTKYQRQGRNTHDDAEDALTGVCEDITEGFADWSGYTS